MLYMLFMQCVYMSYLTSIHRSIYLSIQICSTRYTFLRMLCMLWCYAYLYMLYIHTMHALHIACFACCTCYTHPVNRMCYTYQNVLHMMLHAYNSIPRAAHTIHSLSHSVWGSNLTQKCRLRPFLKVTVSSFFVSRWTGIFKPLDPDVEPHDSCIQTGKDIARAIYDNPEARRSAEKNFSHRTHTFTTRWSGCDGPLSIVASIVKAIPFSDALVG